MLSTESKATHKNRIWLSSVGSLIKQHLEHKEERQRLEVEAVNLEEQSYRIHSPDRAGPSQRRQRPSHGGANDGEPDRVRRRERSKERRCRRRDSPERKYTYDRRERDDKRRSREEVRYTHSPPPKGYYATQPRPHGSRSQMRQPGHSQTGAPSAQWVPPPPQQRMNSPPISTTSPPLTRNPQPYPAYQASPPPLHPTFANEPYAYPPEKLPESMLRPGVPARGRSSSAPGDIYQSSRANTSRVRIAVPGEDELSIPGETTDPPPAYEDIGGRY